MFENIKTDSGTTINLGSEIIWYFLEGLAGRTIPGEKTIYKVAIDGLEHPLIFLHEEETNRWWFEVQSISGETFDVACTKKDYQAAAGNEIPDRWFKFVQKMDGLLK